MTAISPLLTLAITLFGSASTVMAAPVPRSVLSVNNSVLYRPAVHYTPGEGFMNDPNGLIYDEINQLYHMYYQYNPDRAIAGNQHWGHATSQDLMHWEDKPIAIYPTEDGGLAFSGTIVNDVNNTSGLFGNDTSAPNFVAVFTRHYEHHEEQVLMYSNDNGTTFHEYENNPVLDIGSESFRDPQVQWIPERQRWLMTIALSREHIVRFYESKDLKSWKQLSDFQSGIFGVDYECPNLVPVLDEENNIRWVLFISINPGMPLGGSGTQYFVGDFTGTQFIPDDTQKNVLLIADFAKDNYALQHINPGARVQQSASISKNLTADSAYIGWVGNWQYGQETPSNTWRSAMTFGRKLKLKKDWMNITRLVQEPINLDEIRLPATQTDKVNLTSGQGSAVYDLTKGNTTAVEIKVEGCFANFTLPEPGTQRVFLDIFNDNEEALQIGHDATTNQVWIDRGMMYGFENPFFTDKFSASLTQATRKFEWTIILDASVMELYTEEGLTVGTITYFPESPLTKAQLRVPNVGTVAANITITPLKKSMDRVTAV